MHKIFLSALVILISLLFSANLMANLILVDGGATGQWYNPDRDGEGLFVEIVEQSDGSNIIAISWFTYDQFGEQMWLTGQAAITQEAIKVSVPVIVTGGPIFGPDYDKDDLSADPWGTIEVQFQTCDMGNMTYTSSIGFGSGAIDLTRITNVVGVNCVEPPPETEPVIPGKYTGNGVCLYVAEDGLSITSKGSTCPDGHAFTAGIDGEQVGTADLPCRAEVICPDTYAIYPTPTANPQPAFQCTDLAGFAYGEFSGDTVTGVIFARVNANCVAAFVATHEE
jgi:hypothetical protein